MKLLCVVFPDSDITKTFSETSTKTSSVVYYAIAYFKHIPFDNLKYFI